MELFDSVNSELNEFLLANSREKRVTIHEYEGKISWPVSPDGNLVLAGDTAVELGGPGSVSTASLFMLGDPAKVNHGRISIVGEDIGALKRGKISFGKVVRVGTNGVYPEENPGLYRELELVRYGLRLEGYMMRGVSQYLREWVRISREAVNKGFSLKIQGGALIEALIGFDAVAAVEVVFVTSGRKEVEALRKICEKAGNIVMAIQKRSLVHAADCDVCEFREICLEIDGMKPSRRKGSP